MTVIKGVYKKNIGNCMNNSIRNNLQCLVVAVLEKDQSPPTGLGQNLIKVIIIKFCPNI